MSGDLRSWFSSAGGSGSGPATTTTSTQAKARAPSSSPAPARRNVPYTLYFAWPGGGDCGRFPGSGDFAFDSTRTVQPERAAMQPTGEIDFEACLRAVLRLAVDAWPSVAGEEEEEGQGEVLQQLMSSSALPLLAMLFYKRNVRWTRSDKVASSSMTTAAAAAASGLCEVSANGNAHCVDLFTVEELTACLPQQQPRKWKNKSQLVHAFGDKTPYPHACLRLSPFTFEALARAHQLVFCASALEPEDATCVILSQFKKAGTAVATPASLPLPLHKDCWTRLVRVVDWVEAMADALTSAATDDIVYRILHAACDEHALPTQCTCCCALERKRQDLLHRIILGGISCMEKAKKYTEAVHYLTMVVRSWESLRVVELDDAVVGEEEEAQAEGSCTRTSFFMGKIILRLCVDWSSHLHRPGEALELLERVLGEHGLFMSREGSSSSSKSNRLGGVGMGLIRYALRLSQPPRRWIARVKYTMRDMPERHLVLAKQDGKRVEHTTLEEYCRQPDGREEEVLLGFTHGQHCENGIVHTLFGLLMLNTTSSGFNDFVLGAVDQCLRRVEHDLDAYLVECWQTKHAQRLRGVNWERNTLDELSLVCHALGGRCVSVICRTLLDAYEAWCGGVGDLLVWNAHTGRVRFVEVKGPGDSLSDRQRAWGERLLEAGADVEVCYVTWKAEQQQQHKKPSLLLTSSSLGTPTEKKKKERREAVVVIDDDDDD